MRSVKTIRDAELAIAEVYNFLDTFRTKNLDIHGRRVINAGHSQAGTDYVIRDELPDLLADLIKKIKRQFEENVQVNLEHTARAHLPRAAIRAEIDAARGYSIVFRPGSPQSSQIACSSAPTGASIIADWLYKNPADIGFQTIYGVTKLVNPVGVKDTVTVQAVFASPKPFFQKNCLLRFDIKQVGSSKPGGFVSSRLDFF